MKPKAYVPALDGLRAICILMVMYSHLSASDQVPRFMRASPLGPSAVIVFFVLSGFLITSQLQSELRSTSGIRLGRFYVRRFFRLVPAMLLMVATAWILFKLGFVALSKRDIWNAVTYTMDYVKPDTWTLAHLWSLSVEEQFYLLWPVVLLIAGLKRAPKIVFWVLVLCPILRLVCWYDAPNEEFIIRRFELVADGLAFGCLLTLEQERFRNINLWKRLTPNQVVLLGGAVIVICSGIFRFYPRFEIIGDSLIGLAAMLVIASISFFPFEKSTLFLSSRQLVWIGRISYSLYLWQQIFLLPTPRISKVLVPFPADIVCALATACASYYLVESPLRELGKKLTQCGSLTSVFAIGYARIARQGRKLLVRTE
jgi:peptidoglycan/LPS O-acetylase OafA/YrhL